MESELVMRFTCGLIVGFAVLAACTAQAHLSPELIAEWGSEIMNDPAKLGWFKSVRSPHGVPCCDISDGHRTTYEQRPDGFYWVPIAGEWRRVPTESIVFNAGNPIGEAVVWYVKQTGEIVEGTPKIIYYIRCFVPGSGV